MGVLGPVLLDGGVRDAVGAGRGAGVAGAEGAEGVVGAVGVEDAEDEDAEGVVLVGGGHVGAEGVDAGLGDVHEVARVGGAVGGRAEAVGHGDVVGAGAETEGAEGTVVVVAVDVGAEVGPVGVAGAVGVGCVGTETAGHGLGEHTGAGAEAERAGPAAGGGERGDGTAHPRSCPISASFCFESVARTNQ